MKSPITIDRARIWIAVAVMAGVALASFWIDDAMRRRGADEYHRINVRAEPDYYVEKFNFIKLSNEGKANYHVTGERLIHLPQTDQIEISKPHINSFDAQRAPITIIAERAVVDQKSNLITPTRQHDVVHLYDQVSVDRPDGLNSHYMRLETDYLMLIPDDDVIQSDRAVTLLSKNTETHAVGMFANNSSQQLELLSKVHSRIKKRSNN